MRVMAFEKIPVFDEQGIRDTKSYIAAGDLCQIADKTLAGLYPVTYPTARGDKTRWLPSLQGFLCNQNDYPHLAYPAPGYEKATVKSGGCGLCAAVNGVSVLTGKPVSVKAMRDLAKACGARVSGGTDMKRLCQQLCRSYGLQCIQTNSLIALTEHLHKGGVAICNTAGRGMFSTGGHYVTALGFLDGKLCLADPGLYAGKYNTSWRKKAVTLVGDLLLTQPQVLEVDCIGRWPRYYLLQREG